MLWEHGSYNKLPLIVVVQTPIHELKNWPLWRRPYGESERSDDFADV